MLDIYGQSSIIVAMVYGFRKLCCRLRVIVFMLLAVLVCSARAEEVMASAPVVPLVEILNSPAPLAGEFPVHDSGVYAGDWFWMDNHRLIFWTYEKSQDAESTVTQNLARIVGEKQADRHQLYAPYTSVIKIWDVEGGNVIPFRTGRVYCYQDGIVNIDTAGRASDKGTPMTGSLGYEKPFSSDTGRRYMHHSECGEEPASQTRQYMVEHPEEYVKPLRKEDGFVVLGKHRYKDRGPAIPGDFVVLHPAMGTLVTLKINNDLIKDDYYSFAHAYLFVDRRSMVADSEKLPTTRVFIHVLHGKGEVTELKIPAAFKNASWTGGVRLTRRGVLWSNNIWSGQAGIYLSRGDEVRQISADSVVEGKVSPGGCRFAYMNVEKKQFPLQGKLKVINLCEGIK